MTVSYDVFTQAFLSKVTEFDFCRLPEKNRIELVDGYMKRACAKFGEVCQYDIINGDDDKRVFEFDGITDGELDEIIEIVTEGMLVQWLKPLMYAQYNYENMLNTTDFSSYSPAELLKQCVAAYNMCKKDFTNMVREYSYRHGDLTDLHL